MSADKNPRADSKLKRLPEERQAAIIEMMKQPGITQTMVRKELAADGLKTSEPALSEFYSWWHLRERFRQMEANANTMAELAKQQEPGLSTEALEKIGQSVFMDRAIQLERMDPEAASMIWYRMMRLNLKKSDQALVERRIKLLEAQAAKADKAEEVLQDTKLTDEQISAKIKDIFGITK
jgi:hypothetical protein